MSEASVMVVDGVASTPSPNKQPAREVAGESLGSALGSSCAACRFRASCIGHAFRSASAWRQPLVGYRRHLAPGEVLFHAGTKCSLVHVVQAGFLKTVTLSADGVAQITGFPMPGDVLGLEGLSSGVHGSDAIALTQGLVCVISRARLLQASTENEPLCRHLFGALSEEIQSDHSVMLLLGSRSAEERVAGFLVGLSERLAARGYSGSEMGLWMTREDIGGFLGLELETVSRALSSLLRRSLIEVRRRQIHIMDMAGLREIVGGGSLGTRHAVP